jgi:hypothetical protein
MSTEIIQVKGEKILKRAEIINAYVASQLVNVDSEERAD